MTLLTFIGIPKYDLHLMVKAEPFILWLYRIGFIILAVAYTLGGWAASHVMGRKAWMIVIATAVLSAGALLMLYPFDAADMFDYILEGRMLAFYNANPYLQTPSEFPLDPFYSYVGWTKSTAPESSMGTRLAKSSRFERSSSGRSDSIRDAHGSTFQPFARRSCASIMLLACWSPNASTSKVTSATE